VTGLGRIFRTTAFKLSVAFLAISAVGAGLVLGIVAFEVTALIDDETKQTIAAEADGLAEQYAQGGIRRLGYVIEQRTHEAGSSLYLLTSFAGETLAGNIERLPSGVLEKAGFIETRYETTDDSGGERRALARFFVLPGGFRLVVGHDLHDRARIGVLMARAFAIALVVLAVLGALGGLFVARRVLRRIDAMSNASRAIMAGDMAERLPVSGSGDELDRLAENLNHMLARIGELLTGLREVSDNIAHDLRTPLTRLRNQAEEALRRDGDTAQYRAALERTIEESDGLIRIFNALLMIARAEAGADRSGLHEFDIGEAARAVVELYEPAADEVGATLRAEIEPGIPVIGNRELLGQSIANLLDNALKYGASEPALALVAPTAPSDEATPLDQGRVEVALSVKRAAGLVEIIVADHGPGIDAADRARVFDRFVRLEGARSRPGSGLGLSLASAVAHLHGGEVRLEDNGPGLRVIIALPAAPPSPASSALEAVNSSGLDALS
jgi:signal transduction histidine kinase